jgi:hypothetical protein
VPTERQRFRASTAKHASTAKQSGLALDTFSKNEATQGKKSKQTNTVALAAAQQQATAARVT